MLKYVFSLVVLLFFVESALSQTNAEIHEMIGKSGSDRDYHGASAVVIFDHTRVVVEESGRSTATESSLKKILTLSGVKQNSVLSFGYDPLTIKIKLKKIRIFRRDGTIYNVPVRRALDVPSPAGIIFWGGRKKLVTLPNLEIGDAILIMIEKVGFKIAYLQEEKDQDYVPPMYGTFYDVVRFQGSLPVKEKTYTLDIPKNKPIQYGLYNGSATSSITFCGDRVCYEWIAKGIHPLLLAGGMISSSDVGMKLVISTVNDWKEKSRWFYRINEPSLKADDAICEKVKELTKNLITKEEKIAILTHWVAEKIRYVGLSMGKGEGYTVHSAPVTFRDRGGVCKDKAALLVAMLRVAGIESYVVMTEAGSRVEKVPADQFNHCVACVRLPGGGLRLLDPTWAPNSRELWSSAEAKQYVVYGVPEGRTLSLSPYSPPNGNYLKIKSSTKLSENGDLSAELLIRSDGAPDTQLRRWIERTPLAARRRIFEEIVSRIAPNVKIKSCSYTDPNDFTTPTIIKINYQAGGYALTGGGNLWFVPPLQKHLLAQKNISDYLYGTKQGKRRYDFKIRATRFVDFIETISLPAGYHVVNLPEKKKLSGPAADFSFDFKEKNGKIFTRERLVFKHRINPAATYENFREVVQNARKLFDLRILLSKGRVKKQVQNQDKKQDRKQAQNQAKQDKKKSRKQGVK